MPDGIVEGNDARDMQNVYKKLDSEDDCCDKKELVARVKDLFDMPHDSDKHHNTGERQHEIEVGQKPVDEIHAFSIAD